MNEVDTSDNDALPLGELSKDRRLPPLLRRAWYSLNQSFRRRISHLGITPNQYTILRWLQERDAQGLTQRQLTELMASDPNTMTSLLNRMETKGFIERTGHPSDRRAYHVHIKTRGKEIYNQALPIALNLQEQILSHLPAPKRQEFLEQLATVAQACEHSLKNSKKQKP